jgi:hypothetical protein
MNPHLATAGAFDEGRFLPGALVAERYRIVGLVGRGGMGEVYRADDLKLGQAVALKFLPEKVEKDADRLSRLFNEVKIARQVSHPSVCRVYDVIETEGRHFISMEFVDGEDLAALLRRIGRLTLDLSSWYAGNTVLVAVVTAALAAYGLRMSLAGRPIYRDAVLEG